MSKNFLCGARSNEFAVLDRELFMQWTERLPGVHVATNPRKECSVMLYVQHDPGMWPKMSVDPYTGEQEDMDLLHELSTHLPTGQVAVLMQAGFEEDTYLIVAEALAVNSDGETLRMDLSEIHQKIEQAGWR